MARLPEQERAILEPRWDALEAGATLSDHFRIMWELAAPGDEKQQLVHRCYVDSDDPKDHGCITRALDYATGSVSFIEDYLAGELDTYSEVEFLENLGMFLGVASHHVADLCTPVHVGRLVDWRALGFPTRARFHAKVERDIQRHATHPQQREPVLVSLDVEYFWQIARSTYQEAFLGLEAAYQSKDEERIATMTREALAAAITHTANVWHSVLTRTNMTSRTWASQS